ncbi:hypothetical protein THAOC_21843, partial [Thalassiosira oceanica]
MVANRAVEHPPDGDGLVVSDAPSPDLRPFHFLRRQRMRLTAWSVSDRSTSY